VSPDIEVLHESVIGAEGALHVRCYLIWTTECRRLTDR
jgi:hypothetical protein